MTGLAGFTEPATQVLTGVMATGMAWALLRADAASATSRALALAVAFTGLAIFARVYLLSYFPGESLPPWLGLLAFAGGAAYVCAFEWTLRLRRTLPAGQLRTLAGDRAIRIAQGLVVFYALAATAQPSLWMFEFMSRDDAVSSWSWRTVLLFAAPLSIAMLLWTFSMLLCLNRRPDPAERVRLVAVLIACPIIAAGVALPVVWMPLTTVLGLIVLLGGAMRHAQLHGQRGLFMSRFLSPQVASLVNREGLGGAMREAQQPLSVVCCDLRGFTAYAGSHPSGEVLALLRDYYDVVGAAVTGVEGTIKDYAGDGVLILIGAPVAVTDHAERAVRLARRIRADVRALLGTRARAEPPLGIGVGIATGRVTVGVIGGEGRLEYAAVGEAVNLASRLCEQARDGQVLMDEVTAAALGEDSDVAAATPLSLKGFSEPVAPFELGAA